MDHEQLLSIRTGFESYLNGLDKRWDARVAGLLCPTTTARRKRESADAPFGGAENGGEPVAVHLEGEIGQDLGAEVARAAGLRPPRRQRHPLVWAGWLRERRAEVGDVGGGRRGHRDLVAQGGREHREDHVLVRGGRGGDVLVHAGRYLAG